MGSRLDRHRSVEISHTFPINFLFLETTPVPQFLKYSHQLNFVYLSIECEHQIEIYLKRYESPLHGPEPQRIYVQRRRPICCTCRLCGACRLWRTCSSG